MTNRLRASRAACREQPSVVKWRSPDLADDDFLDGDISDEPSTSTSTSNSKRSRGLDRFIVACNDVFRT